MKDHKMITLKINTLRGYVQAISGVFITQDNPTGLSPREMDVLTALLFYADKNKSEYITTHIKKEASISLGHNMQVITNYLQKFRQKKVISTDNKLHP